MTVLPTDTPDHRRIAAMWPFVRAQLAAAPGRVLELGCGRLGGFVPALRADGYDVVGVDPKAPDEPGYVPTEFERCPILAPFDAVIACTSLHHVGDLDAVLDHLTQALVPGGLLVVVEWAHEDFDEATARWSFDRLGDGEGWLRRHRDGWLESGAPWDAYFPAWVRDHGLHASHDVLRALETRFVTRSTARVPYGFHDLAQATAADEQAAIDAGRIRATGVHWVGTVR